MNGHPTSVNRSTFHWLPNVLSGSRGVLSVPIFICALSGRWSVGFWLVLIALLTDFLDGLAAKKLHAESVLGGHIDRVSDFLLAGFGTLGLVIGAHWLSLWILAFCIPASVFVGYVKFLTPSGTKLYDVTSALSVTLLFAIWIGVVWGYATQAFGWSWGYVPITIAVLLIAASGKRHRLAAWFGWIFKRVKS